MKLRWTERATDQLVAVHDYIAQSSPEFAAAVAERIFARPEPQLIDFPYSGSVVPEYGREDIREVFSDSYRINTPSLTRRGPGSSRDSRLNDAAHASTNGRRTKRCNGAAVRTFLAMMNQLPPPADRNRSAVSESIE